MITDNGVQKENIIQKIKGILSKTFNKAISTITADYKSGGMKGLRKNKYYLILPAILILGGTVTVFNQHSSSVPNCNDTIIKDTVISIAFQQYGSDAVQLGITPERFSVENIRTKTKEEKGCTCGADLIINLGSMKKKIPIGYVSELTDDGKPYVTVYGLN
ncbi:MAG: hypothetical protein V1872_15035 [bacterium]